MVMKDRETEQQRQQNRNREVLVYIVIGTKFLD